MPKLYSSDYVAKVLQRKGFVYVSQRGSHVKFHKKMASTSFTAIVPANKKEIPMEHLGLF